MRKLLTVILALGFVALLPQASYAAECVWATVTGDDGNEYCCKTCYTGSGNVQNTFTTNGGSASTGHSYKPPGAAVSPGPDIYDKLKAIAKICLREKIAKTVKYKDADIVFTDNKPAKGGSSRDKQVKDAKKKKEEKDKDKNKGGTASTGDSALDLVTE